MKSLWLYSHMNKQNLELDFFRRNTSAGTFQISVVIFNILVILFTVLIITVTGVVFKHLRNVTFVILL